MNATYVFIDDTGAKTRLELGEKLSVPLVNGKPGDLQPDKVSKPLHELGSRQQRRRPPERLQKLASGLSKATMTD